MAASWVSRNRIDRRRVAVFVKRKIRGSKDRYHFLVLTLRSVVAKEGRKKVIGDRCVGRKPGSLKDQVPRWRVQFFGAHVAMDSGIREEDSDWRPMCLVE